SAGAKVLDGHGFVGVVEHDTDRIVVAVDGIGDVSTRYVVAADGMWSPVRKALGLAVPGYLGEWHGFRQYACTVTGPAKDRLYVWFDADLLPGYAWAFPLAGGRVNVGFGLLRDGPRKVQDMKTLWPELLQRPHIRDALGPDAEMEGRHTAWPIPAGIDRATLSRGRVLFVGDAAMATDSLTGEGIGQALLSGRLAAEAIGAGGPLAAESTRRTYDRQVRHHLLADHRMSVLLGRVLAHERGARGALRAVDVNDWTRRNFARWMFEDEPRAIALTPSRWHRRMFHRDGAFATR
ncbi:MAG: NAD(P)/FAD-dependent oxidoreductase, partial [Ilumatobacteraceae bacterium]